MVKAEANIKTIDNGYLIRWSRSPEDAAHVSGEEYRETKAEVVALLGEIFNE